MALIVEDKIIERAIELVSGEYGENLSLSHTKENMIFLEGDTDDGKVLVVVEVVQAFRASYILLGEMDLIGTV